MHYISTRGNYDPVNSSEAISIGMVPQGGLFVPGELPFTGVDYSSSGYNQTARRVLSELLTDFTSDELDTSISCAYNAGNFDSGSIIDLVKLNDSCSVMELWHGPTAAFKDMALQIMPHFMAVSKRKTKNDSHTVILVATSGDTGKAALEGFKNCEGISIIVFYPHEGVSEIQRLQMATTEGNNTYVVAVKGNFDDCQTGVKNIFSDQELRSGISADGFEFSSANSINWGRLCPQIVYYFRSYQMLVEKGVVGRGEPVNFCVPTGNFGNILAGYYAKRMGLPVAKLICASNENKILSDFFRTGIYDRNREFHKTISPSMDILISSNLERFLFEMTGHGFQDVNLWYGNLGKSGKFAVGDSILEKMQELVVPGWVDEQRVLSTIRDVFDESGYVLDTHTAVAMAVCKEAVHDGTHTIIASTASPFKFSADVLRAITGQNISDEFECIDKLAKISATDIHRAVDGLRDRPVLHDLVIDVDQMKSAVVAIINSLRKTV
jgi:threonine synthase